MIERPNSTTDVEKLYAEAFYRQHEQEFGFNFAKRQILIDNVRVRSIGVQHTIHSIEIEKMTAGEKPTPITTTEVYFEGNDGQAVKNITQVFDLEKLKSGMKIKGPAIILNNTSTVLVEPVCEAEIDLYGNIEIVVLEDHSKNELKDYKEISDVTLDAIELSIFGHRFASIAE